MIAFDELESGKGANQIGAIKRAGDSRWSSHFYSICSLLRLFEATCSVLESIIKEGSTQSQRGDASAAYKMMTSFEFIFILHLMKEIMGINDILCQVLQQKSQDILNAMNMVSTTKSLIQELRNEGWKIFPENVVSFSKKFDIDIPELSSRYAQGSTANGERAFSAVKIVKTRLRNKIEDEFLTNNLLVYIKREIAETFDLDPILDDFVSIKERRLQF
ncbi:uncharacterized protein LOC133805935 [Humulus lupulus]|uniref:uncharacterized protein LOC133805935 n=1 Tax=Humulus lupulus TaxID=3486 RepID=UPI002B403848|nr:uncharacterized protein LOC133805935 [Humulus lupulus]